MKRKLSRLLLAVATVAFASALAVPALAMADESVGSSFADVEGTEWFAEDVEWANGEGLMTGTGDGTNFEPALGTTRSMFVTSLHRLEGEPAPEGADARVPEGKWYTDAALWALDAGVLKGYDNGDLGLGDVLTREQAAVFAYRYAEYKGFDLSEGEDTNILSYLDADKFGSWAIPAVQWACGEGVILGYTGADGELTGYWGPKDEAARSMTAAILHRLVDNVVTPGIEEDEEPATPPVYVHYHSYGEWEGDGDGRHTGICSCGKESDPEECVPGETLTPNGYGSHYAECGKCGFDFISNCEYDADGFCACGSQEGHAAVSSVEGLLALLTDLSEGDEIEITLESDIELDETLEIPEGATVTLDLSDKTISGALDKDAGAIIKNSGTLAIIGGTVENTAVNGGSVITNSGTLTLDDVTVIGAPMDSTGYPAYAVTTSGKLTVEDGTDIKTNRGAISLSNGADVVINGGKLTVSDAADGRNMTLHTIYAYGYDSKLTINDGYFEMNHTSTGGASVICPAGATIDIYGGDFRDAMDDNDWRSTGNFQNYMGYGAPVNVYGGTYDDTTVNKNLAAGYSVVDNADGTWTVSATKVSSSSDLSSAISKGEAVELTDDVEYNSAINKDANIDLAGNTFEATSTIELGNNADLTMTGGDYVVNSTYGHVDVRPTSAEGSVVTFENVNFSFNKLGKTYGPSTNRLGSVVEVCAVTADAKTEIVFKNCTFDNAMVLFEGLSGTVGEFEATFENCTFNCLTSSAPIEVGNYVKGMLNVIGCTFNIEATSSTASAISISPNASTAVTLNAQNNTINAVAAVASGENGTVEQIKVNGTPANIKFISCYDNTTVNESGTTKTGLADF